MAKRGNNSEVKHDVYGNRQTAKMNVLSTLFSCVNSKVKLFVFAMNSMGRYSIFVCFIYGLEEKNSKSEVIFAVCRLPLTSCLTSLLFRNWQRVAHLYCNKLTSQEVWGRIFEYSRRDKCNARAEYGAGRLDVPYTR